MKKSNSEPFVQKFYKPQKNIRKKGTVGYNIYKIREKRNISLKDLAEKASIHRVSLSYIERNTVNATLPVLLKIANALGCELGQLLANVKSA